MLLLITGTEFFPLEGANADRALVGFVDIRGADAEAFEESGVLNLFFPPMEESVVAFLAVFVSMDSHICRAEYGGLFFCASE